MEVLLYLLVFTTFVAGFIVGWYGHQLTPYVAFWYNVCVKRMPVEDQRKPVAVKSFDAYLALTLRRRFTMERDRKLN